MPEKRGTFVLRSELVIPPQCIAPHSVVSVRKKTIIRTVIRAGSTQRMAKRHLRLVTPANVNRTVTPKRLPNSKLRRREYLTEGEVERLMNAAKGNRWGHRDAAMMLVAYRHGLRASELTDLRWDQVDFRTAALHVRRVKQGTPSTHPILGDELRALRRLQREQEPSLRSCSRRSGGHRSAPQGSPAWSSGQGSRPSWLLRHIHTC